MFFIKISLQLSACYSRYKREFDKVCCETSSSMLLRPQHLFEPRIPQPQADSQLYQHVCTNVWLELSPWLLQEWRKVSSHYIVFSFFFFFFFWAHICLSHISNVKRQCCPNVYELILSQLTYTSEFLPLFHIADQRYNNGDQMFLCPVGSDDERSCTTLNDFVLRRIMGLYLDLM